jgi:hypothetical protein
VRFTLGNPPPFSLGSIFAIIVLVLAVALVLNLVPLSAAVVGAALGLLSIARLT